MYTGECLANILVESRSCGGSVAEQDAQVAKIISCGSGDDGVAKGVENRIGIEGGERVADCFGATRTIASTGGGTIERAAIDYGAGGRTVAVDAVGACAQHGYVVSRNLFRAGESELLVPSADATVADGHGHLAAGDQTDTRYFATQFAQTAK